MSKFTDLQIRQIDEALKPFAILQRRPPPPKGWARTIRETLGMSLRQLAERAGISKTAVQNAEANEAKGTVQLDSLRTLAAALDCEFVYALVPRSSLSETLSAQAARAATRMVDRVSDSMELEEQGIGSGDRERQVSELASELLRNRRRDFWDV